MSHEAYDRVGPFYLQYYRTQRGRGETGASPRVFRGAERWRKRQHGDGFGSLLRGLARFLLPVVGRGIGAFASHTLDATERGASLGEATKSALKPTLRAVIDAGAGQMSKQGGNGDKLKRHATESADFYERMQEAKRRKHKRKQSGLGKKRRRHDANKSSSEGFFERMQEAKQRKQSGRGKQKKKTQSGKKKQRGGGKLRKKRVYKTDASSNF